MSPGTSDEIGKTQVSWRHTGIGRKRSELLSPPSPILSPQRERLARWAVPAAYVPQATAITHFIEHSKSWDSDLSQRSCKKACQCLPGRDWREMSE